MHDAEVKVIYGIVGIVRIVSGLCRILFLLF